MFNNIKVETMSKTKKFKYHQSHSFTTADGQKMSVITQLYQIGVYGIVNNDPAAQFNLTPGQLASHEKKLREAKEAGEITNLEFGPKITVAEVDGFWEEI